MAEPTTIATLKPGQGGIVLALPKGVDARRLLELGLVPGTPVKLIRTAPLGDPLQVELRGYMLSLRRELAQAIALDPGTSTGSKST